MAGSRPDSESMDIPLLGCSSHWEASEPGLGVGHTGQGEITHEHLCNGYGEDLAVLSCSIHG